MEIARRIQLQIIIIFVINVGEKNKATKNQNYIKINNKYIYYKKMGKKNYSVTLEEEVVVEAKENLKTGQKLSPVINELLIKFNKEKR